MKTLGKKIKLSTNMQELSGILAIKLLMNQETHSNKQNHEYFLIHWCANI